MIWIAPSEKDVATDTLEKRLWAAADQFRANSGLSAAQYSQPVLGLIFLRFAEVRFAKQRATLEKASASSRRGSRVDEPAAYQAEGILYLAPNARFDFLLSLPEAADIGAKVNDAMRDIEKHNPQLAGVLPKTYNLFTSTLLKELHKKVSEIPAIIKGDTFGRIYEYFLGNFAMTEGQKGGEFYTPSSIVRLLTEVIEPYHGRILDPACGSGGMFVSSARFVSEHKKNPASELSVHGVEKTDETGRLCRRVAVRKDLAVHGLEGDIRHGGQVNSYYDDILHHHRTALLKDDKAYLQAVGGWVNGTRAKPCSKPWRWRRRLQQLRKQPRIPIRGASAATGKADPAEDRQGPRIPAAQGLRSRRR